MAHVSQYKKDVVKKIADLLKEYPIIGAVNMENLPAVQLQNMRALLRKNEIVLFMAKRRLIKLAIELIKGDKKGIEELEKSLKGMPALLFTKENPFKLYNIINKNKSKAPAKAGQEAPNEIIVPAGPTGFAPGPIISELGTVGIKAGIEDGKVVIKEDSPVAKEGDIISGQLASILTRLEIHPMEVGLNVTAVYEDGSIFTKDVLAIDEQEYIDNITKASSWAINLAMEAGIMTDLTTELMITKAFTEAKALALSQNIMADAVAEEIVIKAEREMLSLKFQLNIQIPEKEVKEEKTTETKADEKKESAEEEKTKKPEEIKEEKETPQEEEKKEEKQE